jgi:hypothetical protein
VGTLVIYPDWGEECSAPGNSKTYCHFREIKYILEYREFGSGENENITGIFC